MWVSFDVSGRHVCTPAVLLLVAPEEQRRPRAGAPLHVEIPREIGTDELQAALSSAVFASVGLHDSRYMARARDGWGVIPALAGSASTLTALRGLPLGELRDSSVALGLAPFTRLRAVSIKPRRESPGTLPARLLPACLEELTLTVNNSPTLVDALKPPLLVGFRRLQHLRRITLVGYKQWLNLRYQ